MGPSGDLADPTYEPSDEELQELSKRAFASVRAEHEAVLRKLRAAIEIERSRALAALTRPST